MEDKKTTRKLIREQRTELVLPEHQKKIGVYLTEADADKRLNYLYVRMLEGLSKMLEIWGDFECKGGGVIDPHAALFHCRACTFNGIRGHVNQAIERWSK